MRRLARHLFTILSAISLLLCVMLFFLWRTDYASDGAWPEPVTRHRLTGGIYNGSIRFGILTPVRLTFADLNVPNTITTLPANATYRFPVKLQSYDGTDLPSDDNHSRFGFEYCDLFAGSENGPLVGRYRGVTLPLWLPVGITAVLPTISLTRAVRAHGRRLRGHCPICDYDLRATPERCPECGGAGA